MQYQGLRDDLEQRARDAYITGPASGLEFLLGASSIADLSARMEYVNALSQEDADLATEVQNVRNTLAARKDEQQQLQERAARALQKVQAAEAALEAKLAEQQDALDELNAKHGAGRGARQEAREAVPAGARRAHRSGLPRAARS